MTARLATLLTAAIAIVAIAAGCGGGDGSASSSTGASSAARASFVKKAVLVCSRAREGGFDRLAAYQKKHRADQLPKAVVTQNAFRAVLLATIKAEIAGLEALEAPAGDEKTIEAMLASLHKAFDEGTKVTKMAHGQTPAHQIVARFAAADKELHAYGLTGCTKKE